MNAFSSEKKKLKKIIAWITLALFSLQPVLVMAQAVADPNAPTPNRPTVDSAQNGTPVIQITAPSKAGVSRNLYQEFDITRKGLILNNSYKLSKTQLAGYIQGNPNLKDGLARIILNEITGNNISHLAGYLEVAGQRADVIIANRNGIVGNGFGFINTSRGVLTTGAPVFGGTGSLEAFRVTGGQVNVEEDGIDATESDRFDLISRTAIVNAGIWAKEVNVVTGSNNVAYNTLNTQTVTGEGNQPMVALDVSALGGMYANKIKLVGTEHGVGVNSQGTLSASGGDLTLTNDGKITLGGQLSASGQVTINATDSVKNQGTIYAQGNTNVSSGGTLSNSGIIVAAKDTTVIAQNINSTGALAAGIKSDGTIDTTGNLAVGATNAITATGTNIAGENLFIYGKTIDQSGANTYAGGSAMITATQGDIIHTGAKLDVDGALVMSAAGTVNNNENAKHVAGQIAANQVTITAGDISNQGSSISQTGSGATKLIAAHTIANNAGTIATNGSDLILSATSIDNAQGKVEHAGSGKLTVKPTENLKNQSGTIVSNGTIEVRAQNIKNQSGQILANDDLVLASNQTTDNTSGTISARKDISLGSSGSDLTNAGGTISAGGQLVVHVAAANNTGGNLIANNNLYFAANSLTGNGQIISGQDLQLFLAGNLTNSPGGQIKANRDMSIDVSGTVMNQGSITAVRNAYVTAYDLTNDSGATLAGGDILTLISLGNIKNNGQMDADDVTIWGQNLTNTGKLSADTLTVHSKTMTNSGASSSITSTGDMNLILQGDLLNQGTMYAQGNAKLDDVNILTNTGILASAKDTTIAAQAVVSTGSLGAGIQSGGSVGTSGNLTINAIGAVTAKGQTLSGGDLAITGTAIEQSGGTTYAGANATMTATTGDVNTTGADIQANGALVITAAGNVTNDRDTQGNAGRIMADSVAITATTINNRGGTIKQTGTAATNLKATGSINNAQGTIASNGDTLTLQSSSLTNSSGQIQHAGTGSLAIIATNGLTNNAGKIAGNSQVDIQTQAIDNTNGSIISQQQLTVSASSLTNTQGFLAGDRVQVTAQGAITNNQQGLIQANKDLILKALSLDNQSGKVLNLDNSGTTITVDQAVQNTNGLIGGNGDTVVTAASLVNQGGQVLIQGNLTVNANQGIDNAGGKLLAQQNITLNQSNAALNNANGTISAGGTLTAQASTINNTSGNLIANTDINLTTQSLSGAGSKITAGQDVNITVNSDYIQDDSIQVQANRDINITAKNITNNSTLTAVRNTTLNAAAVTNNAGATLSAGELLKISATGDVNNSGRLDGNAVDVSSQNFNNTGTVTAGSLTVQASAISNSGDAAILAATNAVNLNTTGSVENKDGANIYSMGNITITSGGPVLNQSATIEADGNIAITASEITNKKRIFEVEEKENSEETYSNFIEGWVKFHKGGGGDSYDWEKLIKDLIDPSTAILVYPEKLPSWEEMWGSGKKLIFMLGQTIKETTVTQDSPEGKISAAGNITLHANTVNNNNSSVIAASTLETSGTLNNVAQGRTKTITRHLVDSGQHYTYYDEEGVYENPKDAYKPETIYDETIYEQLPGTTSIFGGGQQVIINGPNVNNITINPINVTGGNFSTLQSTQTSNVTPIQTVLGNTTLQGSNSLGQSGGMTVNPSGTWTNTVGAGVVSKTGMKITLPSNGLFTIHTEPGSHYLVETDPRFANYKNFITSDYMLKQLGINPEKTMKLVGDGFYQQKLVREQISELTGREVLSGYSSTEDEYKALMTNGASYAKLFNLQVGVALTAEQMAQLTSDMVWLVEQDVQGQKVLVPVVYLAPNQKSSLRSNGAIIAADNVQITTSQDILNQNSKIIGDTITLAGRDIKNETTTFVAKTENNEKAGNNTRTIAGQTAEISATGSITLDAKRDIKIIGGKVSADKNITLDAGRNVNIGAVTTTEHTTAKNYLHDTTTNSTSSIKAGNNITMTSQQDVNLSGAQINAGQDLTLKSVDGNVNISAVKDEELLDTKTGTSSNWKRTRTDDEYVIGSNLQAGGKVSISAVKPEDSKETNPNGNVNIAGSNVYSDTGKITIKADNDVTIQEVKEKHESLVQKHKKTSGFLSSKTKDTRDYSLTNQVVGSSISGDSVEINAGKDLTVKGSTVIATNDVSLHADNDVNITSAQETGKDEHYKKVKKSGLFSGGGFGFTIGTQSTKTTLNEQVKDEIGSTVGSIAGNVNITAGNNVTSEGTTIVSGKDISLTGKEVTLDNSVDTYDSQYKYEFKQSGLTVSLGGQLIDAATTIANSVKRSGEVEDNRLKDLYIYKAYQDSKDLNKELVSYEQYKDAYKKALEESTSDPSNLAKKDVLQNEKNKLNQKIDRLLSINIGIGSSKMTQEQTTHVETVNSSNITAGGNVIVTATDEDINLVATNISGKDVTLDAKKGNVNIEADQNIAQNTNKTSSSSWSLGATVGLGTGNFMGITGSAQIGKGNENGTTITNTSSNVDASGTLTIHSGADTNIIGSQVSGEKVDVKADGDLNIVSLQDSENYKASSKNAGIGFGTGKLSGVHGSAGTSKTNSNYKSVTEQAGIYAGKEGFDITVGKNTDLKGSVISSDATPDKNKLSTGTLTYSDIQNKADYNSSSTGVNLDKNGSITPNIGIPASGDANSTTKSAISPGTIEVRSNPNADLSGLSRDLSGTVNALGKIFDKKTVQERQELANVFTKEAFNYIGELAFDKLQKAEEDFKNAKTPEAKADAERRIAQWSEGGEYKTLFHTVIGGIASYFASGNFVSGAVGAGTNEAIQNELSKIKDPALHEWASLIVGAVASDLVGGDALTGGTIAVSGTRDNYIHLLLEKIVQICEDAPALRAILVRMGIIAESGVILDEVAASRIVYISRVGAPLAEKEIDEVVTVSRQLDALATQASESLTLAQRVNAWVDGTRMHTIFQNLIKGTGNEAIQTEQTFLNGSPATYGTAGAVRLDAVLYNAEGAIIAVYDLKTGVAGLTQYRVEAIRRSLGNLAIPNVPVFEIRP